MHHLEWERKSIPFVHVEGVSPSYDSFYINFEMLTYLSLVAVITVELPLV